MKKSFAFLFVLLSSSLVFAQTITKPLFFEIEKNGNKAYMLGTIHMGVGFSWLPQYVQDEAYSASTLVVESDIEKAQTVMLQKFPMPAPVSLKSQLTATQWQTLVSRTKAFGMSEQMLDGMYPFLAMMILEAQTSSSPSVPNVKDPLDMTVMQIGKQPGKTLDFLETVDSALDVLVNTMDIDALRAALDAPPVTATTNLNDMIQVYLMGDEDLLYKLMVGQNAATPDNLVELLDNRNIAWIPEINRIIKNQGIEFFAFGAGHLGGSVGVIELLKKDGYTVKKIVK